MQPIASLAHMSPPTLSPFHPAKHALHHQRPPIQVYMNNAPFTSWHPSLHTSIPLGHLPTPGSAVGASGNKKEASRKKNVNLTASFLLVLTAGRQKDGYTVNLFFPCQFFATATPVPLPRHHFRRRSKKLPHRLKSKKKQQQQQTLMRGTFVSSQN